LKDLRRYKLDVWHVILQLQSCVMYSTRCLYRSTQRLTLSARMRRGSRSCAMSCMSGCVDKSRTPYSTVMRCRYDEPSAKNKSCIT
jgi:hypothetical protein